MNRFALGAAMAAVCALVAVGVVGTRSFAVGAAPSQQSVVAAPVVATAAESPSLPAPAPARATACSAAERSKTRGLVTRKARRSTARALESALAERGLDELGFAWIGKLDSVGNGTRDTILYVPHDLVLERPVELVVYMEGHRSFSDRAIRDRHVAGIARLIADDRNFVYVSPDVPSSTHGSNPQSAKPYWSGACDRDRKCGRGDQAPGDFVAFYEDVLELVDEALCHRLAQVDALELELVGFSNGGRGVHTAVVQLAASESDVNLVSVNLTRVVFADAIYGRHWLDQTWERVRDLPTLEDVSLLLIDGSFSGGGPGSRNRGNARGFLRDYQLDRRAKPQRSAHLQRDQVHVVKLDRSHRAIGDYAVYYQPADVVQP